MAMAAEKRSISFDPETLRAAEQLASSEHGGNLSALVNDTLERRVKARRLLEFLAELDQELGPVPEDVKREVDAQWEKWESPSTPEP